jgi:Zn-dependent M28 family amino/carboxypeptidase
LALLQKSEPTVGLRIQSQRTPGYSQNVIGRKSGASQAKVVLCAHYDTKIDTPGACDNAGGVAVLLALADLLGARERALGLECVAFSNEEYLPMGDDEYVRLCGHQFDQIVAAINFDGAGQYLGANNITMMANSESFRDRVAELTLSYRGVVWVAPWPESNHSTFANRGVPSIAFGSRGASLEHLRSDTIEWVSPAKLSEVVSLAADIVESLQEKAPDWTREPKATDPDRDG